MASTEQKDRVKKMLVEQLHLRIKPEEIADDGALFGEPGLGLDSVDAIELVAGLEQEFGVKFASEDEAREHLVDVETLAAWLEGKGAF